MMTLEKDSYLDDVPQYNCGNCVNLTDEDWCNKYQTTLELRISKIWKCDECVGATHSAIIAELVEKFENLNVGDKVTIAYKSIFGGVAKYKATFMGGLEPHGVWTSCGAWAKYPSKSTPGETKCYKVNLRLYKKRTTRIFLLGFDILDITPGWKEVRV